MNDHARRLLAQIAVRASHLISSWHGVLLGDAVPESERPQWLEWIEGQEWAISEVERLVPDDDLLAAYQRTNGTPDSLEANSFLAEIERRGLVL